MPAPEILAVLDRLLHAYPEKRLEKPTLKVYLEELADIPPQLLEQAASQHIRSSPYFPRIAELRQISHQLSGIANFNALAFPPTDHLDLQAFQLHHAFFTLGEFEDHVWQSLIKQFENVGRHYRAEELRQHLSHLRQVHTARQAGKDWPPSAHRRRYSQWSQLVINGFDN
jgi:hypothetical protein